MSGAPGSGKSTTAKSLAQSIVGTLVIDHDLLRSFFLENGLQFEQSAKLAYNLGWTLAEDMMKQGHNVIMDSTCNFQTVLDNGTALALKYGYSHKYVELPANASVIAVPSISSTTPSRDATLGQHRIPMTHEMDPKVIILLMFLVAGFGFLFLIVRGYISRENAKQDAAVFAATAAKLNRDRGFGDSTLISPTPQLPGFRWRWEKKFRQKQEEVKEMLERHLKLLHVMATVKYEDKETNEIIDSWKDISTYMGDNPICTSVLPSQPPIVQRRLFMFDTLRYLRLNKSMIPGKRMEEWFGEFESIFLLGVLKVDAWKVYLDNCRRLALSTPWLKVWNYRPREHLEFLFMPLVTPKAGKNGMMSRFVISFADLTLVETPKVPTQSAWARWWPFSLSSPSPDWVDLAIDHRKYRETAPPYVPSEQLLLENSSDIVITRALVHKRLIVMDVCKPDGGDMSFDITSSDFSVHLALLPLLHTPKHAPVPMELVVILFRRSMQSWNQFKDAFLEHVTALSLVKLTRGDEPAVQKSYIYDNRAQKAMIDTIMSSLKTVHSLGTIAEHNITASNKFLEENTKSIDGNISAFWSWESPAPTLRQTLPEMADDLEEVAKFFGAASMESKDWDKELRSMMQMVFSLVSIDEAYRSREQAQSLKRLSWITFIFLPLLFAASLFDSNASNTQDQLRYYVAL
ncbi:hypothetical protein Dda_5667 [Drechslerella dactyloides]|uniref:Uncharacterized protein n=1 Tax=Drechslerella dactyloides TaxID=74499 RepID=A0AAD6J0X5_DREDA|nr:hypothetical protein Dda_5667 [Drechslerella dactyloides]